MGYLDATQIKNSLSNQKNNMRNAFYILCSILIAGCAKQDDCTPSSQSFTFQVSKSVDISASEVKAINGSSTVFKFQYNYEQCEGAVGSPVSREIYFEVPTTLQNNFSYANESLLQSNAVIYLKAPIDPALRIKRIVSGTIQGTKINLTKWHITASVNSGSEVINFENDFIRTD